MGRCCEGRDYGNCACSVVAGANIKVTGDGSSSNPYMIEGTGGGGGCSCRVQGAGITQVTGDGSIADPYVVRTDQPPPSCACSVRGKDAVTVTGTGDAATPYVVGVDLPFRLFADAAARDSAWPNPPIGARCVTADTGTEWQFQAGVWRQTAGQQLVSAIYAGGGLSTTPTVLGQSKLDLVKGSYYRLDLGSTITTTSPNACARILANYVPPTGGDPQFFGQAWFGTIGSYSAAGGTSSHTIDFLATLTGEWTIQLSGIVSQGTGVSQSNTWLIATTTGRTGTVNTGTTPTRWTAPEPAV